MTSKRTISATNETGWLSQVIKPVIFVRLDFAGGVKRYHTEIGPITATHPTHGAESYSGIGDFGGLTSEVIETIAGAPQALKLSLTAVKSTLINDALTDDYFRRECEVMVGLENSSGALIDDPEILFSGYMDNVVMSLGEKTGIMTLSCESRGTNALFASDNRFTDEDKQAEVSGDLFGEYIYRMQDLTLKWGGGPVGAGGGGPASSSSPSEGRIRFQR